MFNNKRGFSIPNLLFTIIIILGLMSISIIGYYRYLQSQKTAEVTSDSSQLESAVKSYYLVNNLYPAKYAMNIGDPLSGLDLNQAFWSLKSNINLSDTEINDRFKPVDIDLLVAGKYIAQLSSPEEFIVDIADGSIYYVKQLSETGRAPFAQAKSQIEKASGLNLKLETIGQVGLQDGPVTMNKVNTSLTVGDKVIVGGDGSMWLATVQTSTSRGITQSVVTDISNKITGTSVSVGDLKYLGENKVLVHYSDSGVLSYSTITVD